MLSCFYQAGIDHWFYQCLCIYTHKIQQVEQWTFKWTKIFEGHLHCCMNISCLEAYGLAVISQANLILKLYISVGGQK